MSFMASHENLIGEELLDFTRLLRRHLRRRIGRPWPRAHLTAAQVDLLRVVSQQPQIGVGAAAAELGLAPNTVSTLVGQLIDAGIVLRETDPHDGRAVRLKLSGSAVKRIKHLQDQRSTLLGAALAELSMRDLARIEAALPALRRVGELLRNETEATS